MTTPMHIEQLYTHRNPARGHGRPAAGTGPRGRRGRGAAPSPLRAGLTRGLGWP